MSFFVSQPQQTVNMATQPAGVSPNDTAWWSMTPTFGTHASMVSDFTAEIPHPLGPGRALSPEHAVARLNLEHHLKTLLQQVSSPFTLIIHTSRDLLDLDLHLEPR